MAINKKFRSYAWWNSPSGKAHESVLKYARTVENRQALFYWQCRCLEAAIDQNPRTNPVGGRYRFRGTATGNGPGAAVDAQAIITENLIVQQINTAAAYISDTDISIRVQTDNADWSHKRNAKRLQYYANGLMALYDVVDKCQYGFKNGAALKGTAVNKVWIDEFDQINVRPVPIENILVDELECRDMRPMQLHFREFYDREKLISLFPEYAEEIAKAHSATDTKWAGYRPIDKNEVVVIESWRLPIGPIDHKRHVSGRHTICIQGCDLLDEPYEDPFFPFAIMRWDDPVNGFYGHGLAERIFPIQTQLNKRNWQIDRSIDKQIHPTVWVHKNDRDLAIKSFSRTGLNVGTYRQAIPQGMEYKAVAQDVYADPARLQAMAERQNGVNQMMISGNVPAGVQTGEAVRQVRITHSQRFSLQQHAYEQFIRQTVWLIIAMCKKLGPDKVPDVLHEAKYGGISPRTLKWKDIALDDLKFELAVSAAVTDTPAGRQQRITEMAQAGIITMDETRQLIDEPDIEKTLSAYNSSAESIQWVIERIEDGETGIVPEPLQNLSMGVRMLQCEYNLIQPQGAPESVLECLSDWISTAANLLNPPAPPQMPAMPGAPGPQGMPPGMVPPPNAAAVSAVAPGAFNPVAG